MSKSCAAVKAAGNSFAGWTFFWNGFERPVSVVPGWRATQAVRCFLSSMAQFFVSMLSAALDAR